MVACSDLLPDVPKLMHIETLVLAIVMLAPPGSPERVGESRSWRVTAHELRYNLKLRMQVVVRSRGFEGCRRRSQRGQSNPD